MFSFALGALDKTQCLRWKKLQSKGGAFLQEDNLEEYKYRLLVKKIQIIKKFLMSSGLYCLIIFVFYFLLLASGSPSGERPMNVCGPKLLKTMRTICKETDCDVFRIQHSKHPEYPMNAEYHKDSEYSKDSKNPKYPKDPLDCCIYGCVYSDFQAICCMN